MRSNRNDQQIIRISSNEVAIQSSVHQQVLIIDHNETDIDDNGDLGGGVDDGDLDGDDDGDIGGDDDDGDLGGGAGGGVAHRNGQAQH